ncbi:hypothetical protein [Ruminococcus sp. FC2018]|uniref:hypothetical protein n=1 Tax=Ruminococcus sp. FC2018 TaxID=1410617 RepID=UPI000686C71A|nr:hypothetical protein [Ruminococcus sp. FC2018]
MADKQELDRMNRVAEYINRYYEFEEAVDISKQNKEYLKTYIKDDAAVAKEFGLKDKIFKELGKIGAGAAVLGITMLFIFGMSAWLLAIIVAVISFVLGIVVVYVMQNMKLNKEKEEQHEINRGIQEQIEILDGRIKQTERQCEDYRKGLEKRLDFITPDYISSISTIKGFLVSGEAETCEDAVALYEQGLLMQKMTDVMSKSNRKPLDMDFKKQKEKFGDPLAQIRSQRAIRSSRF